MSETVKKQEEEKAEKTTTANTSTNNSNKISTRNTTSNSRTRSNKDHNEQKTLKSSAKADANASAKDEEAASEEDDGTSVRPSNIEAANRPSKRPRLDQASSKDQDQPPVRRHQQQQQQRKINTRTKSSQTARQEQQKKTSESEVTVVNDNEQDEEDLGKTTGKAAEDEKEQEAQQEQEEAPSKQNKKKSNNKSDKQKQKKNTAEENINSSNSDQDKGDKQQQRLPKRKVALLIGYSGNGYSGSQINPQVETIEGRFFEALVKAGCISEDNSTSVQKVSLQRTARTDAGVSAAINVLCMKLILNPPALPSDFALNDFINTFLPPQLKVWALTRVQNGFNARMSCDSRVYEYNLPTYVFLPPRPGTEMAKRLQKYSTDSSSAAFDPFWSDLIKETSLDEVSSLDFQSDLKKRRAWRITSETMKHLRDCLNEYLGSHNYHNFTVGKQFSDRSSQRVIKQVSVSEPFMVKDSEWISIKIHGQSFMLHQIRKMIGFIVLVVRSKTPATLVPETYGPKRIHVPKAPSIGLLLEKPLFESYNSKVQKHNQNISERKASGRQVQEELKESITDEKVIDSVDSFKNDIIRPSMWTEEAEKDIFGTWLNFLDVYQSDDFNYLNPKGIIPPEAVLDKDKKIDEKNVDEEDEKAIVNKNIDDYEG